MQAAAYLSNSYDEMLTSNHRYHTLPPMTHYDEPDQTPYLDDVRLVQPPGELLQNVSFLILAYWPIV